MHCYTKIDIVHILSSSNDAYQHRVAATLLLLQAFSKNTYLINLMLYLVEIKSLEPTFFVIINHPQNTKSQ